MDILLAGGAGFIGSHCAVAAAKAGYRVIVADNFSNASPEAVRRAEKLGGAPIRLYEADVTDRAAMDRVFSENDVRAVIHFAGFKAVGESTQKPLQYYRNNLDTTLTLLESMAAHGVERFVFSSSATVYGTAEPPFTEDMPTGACTNPYGTTKYMIERIASDAAAADPGLGVVLLRYFNPVGAHESGLMGEDPAGIPNNLMPYIAQVAVGKRDFLRVYGDDYPTPDGTGVRDYIHIMDLAEGHVAALRYSLEHTGCEIFNLGTGRGVSVLEMVKAFEKASGRPIPYRITPRRAGDVAVSYADVSKAARVLGWTARRGLADMCADAWRWQQSNPDGYRG